MLRPPRGPSSLPGHTYHAEGQSIQKRVDFRCPGGREEQVLQTENRTAKAGQWALVRLLEGGGLAAMVMWREGGGQGPSAPRATLSLPGRIGSPDSELLPQCWPQPLVPGRPRTKSGATQDGGPTPQTPGASTPENLSALSAQSRDPSLCRSVLWALSVPCGQGAILMGEGPPPA